MDRQELIKLIDSERQNPYSSLSYHAWVSTKFKYFFVGIPKVAGTKIKLMLQHIEGYPIPEFVGEIHSRENLNYPFVKKLTDFNTEEALQILTSPEWFRFSFVRNPYDRLFSTYKSKIGDNENMENEELRNSLRRSFGYPLRDGQPAGRIAFRDFVRFVQALQGRPQDDHWQLQTKLLMHDVIKYDFIGRMEKFSEHFSLVLYKLGAPIEDVSSVAGLVNETTKIYNAAVYDKELADIVYEIYKEDFLFLGYDRDSWLFDY
ncbi:MAG: sulfotransferase family 2 domain-containing protein [Chloroflexi bacterium]|nr:sulfotransferase family 2 domain-containing protein [Chloroflexota bacterium]